MTNESNIPYFNVNASLIRSLGEKVAPDEATAIIELIRNAFDADAERVNVEIDTQHIATLDGLYFKPHSIGFIRIQDNGKGMSWEEVKRNWLNFAYSGKQKSKGETTTEKKRAPVGGRGMGRMGALRIGNFIELFTSTAQEGKLNHVALDWDEFTEDRPLTDVPLFSEQLPGSIQNGTSIYIFPLRNLDLWRGVSGKELITNLTNGISLFADRKSFRISVKLNGREVLADPGVGQRKTANKVIIQNAWGRMSPALVEEVISFWDQNKMIKPGFSSEERARQVVLILRDADTKAIVGLSTAGVATFKQLNSNNFYLYRSIILPGYRHPGLTSKVIVETRDLLEAYNMKDGNNLCKGILTFVENPRIQQFRREAIWPASKMTYIGMDKEGRHIRVYYFKGATI